MNKFGPIDERDRDLAGHVRPACALLAAAGSAAAAVEPHPYRTLDGLGPLAGSCTADEMAVAGATRL